MIPGAGKYAFKRQLVSRNTAVLVAETYEEEEKGSSIIDSVTEERRELDEETIDKIDASFICSPDAKV